MRIAESYQLKGAAYAAPFFVLQQSTVLTSLGIRWQIKR
jgi:hypothetical protein